MITPERALELASIFANYADNLRWITEDSGLSSMQKARLEIYSDAEKIFRHYAEIVQAEPVAVIRHEKDGDSLDWGTATLPPKDVTRLIIKPEPLK